MWWGMIDSSGYGGRPTTNSGGASLPARLRGRRTSTMHDAPLSRAVHDGFWRHAQRIYEELDGMFERNVDKFQGAGFPHVGADVVSAVPQIRWVDPEPLEKILYELAHEQNARAALAEKPLLGTVDHVSLYLMRAILAREQPHYHIVYLVGDVSCAPGHTSRQLINSAGQSTDARARRTGGDCEDWRSTGSQSGSN
jgi:hypothetical protein